MKETENNLIENLSVIHCGNKTKFFYLWIGERKSYYETDETKLYEISNFNEKGEYEGLVLRYNEEGKETTRSQYNNGIIVNNVTKIFSIDGSISFISISDESLSLSLFWDDCKNLIQIIKEEQISPNRSKEIERIKFYPNENVEEDETHPKYYLKRIVFTNGDTLSNHYFLNGNMKSRVWTSLDQTKKIHEYWKQKGTKNLSQKITTTKN